MVYALQSAGRVLVQGYFMTRSLPIEAPESRDARNPMKSVLLRVSGDPLQCSHIIHLKTFVKC